MRRLIVLVLISAATFVASLTQLSDWDTFHHLAYGRDILRRGGFASQDPFLYPLAGHSAGAQPSWLGSVVIYLSWLAAGDPGPVYLAGLMGAALFVLLAVDAGGGDATREGLIITLLPLSFALAVFRERAVARPELFANVLLAWTLLALRRHAGGAGRLALAFSLVTILWVNLHQSVLAGVAMLAIFVAVNGALLAARRLGLPVLCEVSRAQSLVAPTVALLGGLAAMAVFSQGSASPLRSPVDFVLSVVSRSTGAGSAPGGDQVSLLSRMVDELRPLTPRQWLGPFGWLTILCAVSFVLAWRGVNLREVTTCAAFVYLAATAQRFMVLAAIVMAPVTARNLRAALTGVPLPGARFVRWGVVVAGAIGVSIATWSMFQLPGIRFGTGIGREIPVRSVEYLKSIGFSGRVFNTFHFGGFLEWALDQQVFQDGRGHLLAEDAPAAFAGPSAYATFEALDRRYRFDALVTHYPQFVGAAFRERAGSLTGADWGADRTTWALVAFDDGGQVYLRRDGAYAAFATRDEYRYATPANSLALPQHGDRAALRRDLERSLRETPDCLRCRTMLGFLLLDTGAAGRAEATLLAAVRGLPETQLYALLGLARAAEARGDRITAASRWREIVALAPDPSWSRRQLAGLLFRDGRLGDAWSAIRKNLGHLGENSEDLEMAIMIAQARRDGQAVWELSSRLAAARAVERAEDLRAAGLALLKSGRLTEAIEALSQASQLNERLPSTHFALAQAYELRGHGQQAATEYRRYLELEPAGRWSQAAREGLARLRERSR